MDVFRTPDERFEGLPELDLEPRYHEWDGLRLARVEAGDGPPVVMLHGQPTWSFLFRRAFEPLVAAGHRCIAFDQPGFGRSDKPLDEGWYSWERHTLAVASLFEALDLRDVTLVMHDWGGPIGLRLATQVMPERVARLVAMDTVVLTGNEPLGESWEWFRDLVAGREDFPVGRIVRMGCRTRPPKSIAAAYDAPFPDAASKAAVRAFPTLIPLTPDAPGADAGRAIAAALREERRPALVLWAESDAIFPREQLAGRLADQIATAGEPRIVEGAGHFVPEDAGERIGSEIARWLANGSG
jgi:haloalkane dehalogenase